MGTTGSDRRCRSRAGLRWYGGSRRPAARVPPSVPPLPPARKPDDHSPHAKHPVRFRYQRRRQAFAMRRAILDRVLSRCCHVAIEDCRGCPQLPPCSEARNSRSSVPGVPFLSFRGLWVRSPRGPPPLSCALAISTLLGSLDLAPVGADWARIARAAQRACRSGG